jgi:hypothetical protein
MVAAVFLMPALIAGTPARGDFSYHGSLAAGRLLEIRDINGAIVVRPSRQLEIRATKRGPAGAPDEVQITTHTTHAGLLVCVRYPGDGADCENQSPHTGEIRTRVDFAIAVPPGVNIDANTVNGIVDVRSDAKVTAAVVNGRVTVDASDLDTASSVNGAIDVRLHGTASHAAISLRTVSGRIVCTLPAGIGLRVHAQALDGSVDIAGLKATRSMIGAGTSADGVIGDGKRPIDLQTINGSIRIVRN